MLPPTARETSSTGQTGQRRRKRRDEKRARERSREAGARAAVGKIDLKRAE